MNACMLRSVISSNKQHLIVRKETEHSTHQRKKKANILRKKERKKERKIESKL